MSHDLLALTAQLIDIPSVFPDEGPIADWIEARLRGVPWLAVDRVDNNVVARTSQGRPQRLVLAGHVDTVPPNGNDGARVDDDTLWGLGAADMKGGLAVLLELAARVDTPAVDVAYVFYAAEEVEATHNGLGHLFRQRPELVAGDAAILGEPTGGVLEAGCQGTIRVAVTLTGARAHTARPWMGRNAIHRLGPVLARCAEYQDRRPVLDGCEYREALQAVLVDGGVGGNVVPDRVTLTVNHRFAPDRSEADAEAWLRSWLALTLEEGDTIEVVDVAPSARPQLDHPLLAALVGRGLGVRAKLGWTDVARFAAHGIPAVNFGPGDPLLAHTAHERVGRAELDDAYQVLFDVLTARTA